MKTKKIIALLLTLSVLLSVSSIMANAENSSLDAKYDTLFEQKLDYYFDLWANDMHSVPSSYWGVHSAFDSRTTLAILLYTDTAKTFTYEKVETEEVDYDGGDPPHWGDIDVYFSGEDFYVRSPEINMVVEKNYVYKMEARSYLRACVQEFNIPKEEIIEARRRAQEDPEFIRELFPFLTDEEFDSAKKSINGLYIQYMIPDFAIEALYIEDDEIANSLLGRPEAVYVKELNRMVTIHELDMYPVLDNENGFYVSVDDLLEFDLTTKGFGAFIEWCLKKIGSLDYEYRVLNSERERQIANRPPQTGEALYLIPVAIVSLALGTLVIYPRRRKIDNI